MLFNIVITQPPVLLLSAGKEPSTATIDASRPSGEGPARTTLLWLIWSNHRCPSKPVSHRERNFIFTSDMLHFERGKWLLLAFCRSLELASAKGIDDGAP